MADAERWSRVQELFDAAVEREPAERAAYLAAECAGDEALRAEVEALLRSDAEAGGFLQEPLPSASGLFPLDEEDLETKGRVGKYEIVGKIGQGGFGIVYKGRDPVLRRSVAIKTCTSRDEKLRQRFYREAQIAAGLQHPNVVTVHDLGFQEGFPYLVQEYLEGEDLSQTIRRGDPLALQSKTEVLLQIARGLEYAHSKGVLHRDVKPGNVRLLPDGSAKILDFGIAKLLHEDSGLTSKGFAVGTVGYLAPEQFRGEPVDRRADVFAFGVLAYELIAGRRPFTGANFSEVTHRLLTLEPPPLSDLVRDCSDRLSALVSACLAKDPARRPAGFSEVLAVLEPEVKLLRSGPRPGLSLRPAAAAIETTVSLSRDTARPPTGPVETVPMRGRTTRAVIAAVAVAAAGTAVWLVRHNEGAPVADQRSDPPVISTPAVPAPFIREEQAPPSTPAPEPEAIETAPEESRRKEAPPQRELSRPERQPETEPTPTPVFVPPLPTETTQPGKAEEAKPPEPISAPDPIPVNPAQMQVGQLIRPGDPGVIVAPRLLRREEPEYPPKALRRRAEAQVKVGVLVDETGAVRRTMIVKSGGAELGFDSAAAEAARKSRFLAPTRDGIAGRMWTQLEFEFKLPR